MAEEKKQGSSGLTTTLPVTVVLAILAGLVFRHSLPYQDERPSTRPFQVRYAAAQDVDARLWQDPFVAVYGVSEETPTEKVFIVASPNGKTLQMDATRQAANPLSHTPDQIYKGKELTSDDKIIIFAVTLSGGPYQEDGEQRMRRRYAVLSALANQGAVPQDEQHLGYFQPDPDPKMVLQKRVSFEWWSLPADNRKVLLLWVDESSLFGQPAAKLRELLFQATKEKPIKGTVSNYAVIGPNTSTLMRDMLKEVEGGKKSSSVTKCADKPGANAAKSTLGEINGHEIVYYSAGATASDERLLQDIKQTTECKTVSGYLRDRGVTLYRTTARDDAMMDVLLDELDVRRVKKTDHVVILSEWDTFYGQVMPEAFRKTWSIHYKIRDKNAEPVHVYGYMRGLDGKLPEQGDKAGSSAEKKSDSKDKSGADALIEFPEGQSQKDYLRRLTDSILELDQYLKEGGYGNGGRNGVVAIGVLGSDVHDKLLILEALRQYFPHKLFFTTDLDAAYSHPAKWPQTHNLLVASAYDLELRPELQDKIPPFRDSYQTAFFLATQMALEKELKGEKAIVDSIDMLYPRLFEIGRSYPVPLPTSGDSASSTRMDSGNESKCSWTNWLMCNKIVHPRIVAKSRLQWGIIGVMVVLLVPILLGFVSWRVRKKLLQFLEYCKSYPYFASCAGVALVLAAYYLTWLWNLYIIQIDAEPFYWLEGVSIWPSQLLRLSAFPFAIGFFFWGRMRIRKMQNDLQAQRGAETQRTFALPAEPEHLGNCDVLFVGSWKPEVNNQEVVFPDVLWKKYLGYCRQKKLGCSGSLLRVMVHGLVFLAVAGLLIAAANPPNLPARGDFAEIINITIICFAVPSTILLAMWVVEHARLCERLITHLTSKPSQWNEIARDWAIRDNKVAPECVPDWLDIQLVARLTATIQPLIWGPVVCIGLLVLARSPAIDDWDIPWGLGVVLIAMLFYSISAEIFLQRGAKRARVKAIDQLTGKIREQRNLDRPDEAAIKRIEAEIERISTLREGAFRPWYELPLLRSFGGLGTLVFVLQYLAEVWRSGTF